MSQIDIYKTKKKLAIIFTVIVFCIAFLLELIFFTIRYYNISYKEKRDFHFLSSQLELQLQNNPYFFKNFIIEGIKFRPFGNGKGWREKPERGFRFTNFIVLDNQNQIIAQNLGQEFDGYENISEKIGKNILFYSIDISDIGDNYGKIILLKKIEYDFQDYFFDVLFFLLFTVIFSVFIYLFGLYFVGKNLKPVQESLQDMNDFIHNANHELKTPISVISSNLQLLKSMKVYDTELLESSIGEIKRLDELLYGLSTLSHISSVGKVQKIDLKAEIDKIIQEYKHIIEQKGIIISLDIPDNIFIHSNTEYFYIFFSNLLRNAIKFNTDIQPKIDIIYQTERKILSISNTSLGIDAEDVPKIFDRFYKAHNSKDTSGYGIGLSLVKKICDIYGWKINIISVLGGKTTFEIYIK